MTVIDFLDFSGNDCLINRFSALVSAEGPAAAVSFAQEHATDGVSPTLIAELARRVAAAITSDDDSNEAESEFFALSDLLVRTRAEILEAETQAFDRAWAARAVANPHPISTGPWAQLILKYPDLHEPRHHTPWADGYYSGVLAALRWCLGSGWNADT
jgi:hypothetical protein